jgi:DNA polymerase-1
MPIQGNEADLMKLAMTQIDTLLGKQYKDVNLLLQIHDSILLECSEGDAKRVGELLKNTMEDVYKLPVRLDVDVTVGDNWGQL